MDALAKELMGHTVGRANQVWLLCDIAPAPRCTAAEPYVHCRVVALECALRPHSRWLSVFHLAADVHRRQ
jgi:hypothetical protein